MWGPTNGFRLPLPPTHEAGWRQQVWRWVTASWLLRAAHSIVHRHVLYNDMNPGCERYTNPFAQSSICSCFHLEVDECLEKDVCDQLCVHMNGSLTCACSEGYHLNASTGECKAKGEKLNMCWNTAPANVFRAWSVFFPSYEAGC